MINYSTRIVIVKAGMITDIIWISIGVSTRYNWDSQFFSFFNRAICFIWVSTVYHKSGIRGIFYTAQEFFSTRARCFKRCNFSFLGNFESVPTSHTFNFFQKRAIRFWIIPQFVRVPPNQRVDEVLTSERTASSATISAAYFLVPTNNTTASLAAASRMVVCLVSVYFSLLQVDNVGIVTFTVKMYLALRIPATSLVTPKYTSLKKLFHCENCHVSISFLFFISS